jgi:hypothetical protein
MFKKKSIFLAFAVCTSAALFVLVACSGKRSPGVPALLSLGAVPLRLDKGVFEEELLGIKGLGDAQVKFLTSAYILNGGVYNLAVSLDSKVVEGSKSTNRDEIIRALRMIRTLRKKGSVPVFNRPFDTTPSALLPEWTEVEIIDPDDLKKETVKIAGDGEEAADWVRILFDKREYWAASNDLLRKTVDETEGVIIRDLDLFKTPQYSINAKLGRFLRGMKVKSRGYAYPERLYGNTYINVEIYDKVGWCAAANVILGARTGVMKRDEPLFVHPEDLKVNRAVGVAYAKFDIVPVVEYREDDWAKVVVNANNKFYYVKDGKDAISDDPVDIAFASYVRDDFNRVKPVVRELTTALASSNPRSALAKIDNVRGRLDLLAVVRKRIEDLLAKKDYRDSIFVRSNSPFALGTFTQELFELVNESEYVLGSDREGGPSVGSEKGATPL